MKKIVLSTYVLLLLLVVSCEKIGQEAIVNQTVEMSRIDKFKSLSEAYFNTHPDESARAQKVTQRGVDFLQYNQNDTDLKGKSILSLQPVYAHGIKGVAYYEIWFTQDGVTPKGWVLLSATDQDLPVVAYSGGIPYSYHLKSTPAPEGSKTYQFGVSYYVLESPDGIKLAEYGSMPASLPDPASIGTYRSGRLSEKDVKMVAIDNYEKLKQVFPSVYYTPEMMEAARTTEIAPDGYDYNYITGEVGYFKQIPPYTSVNQKKCYSGCVNNAWLNLYSWWDTNKGIEDLIPTTSTGEKSCRMRNTPERQQATDPVQMELARDGSTYCNGDQGTTFLWNCQNGKAYASRKGYEIDYNYVSRILSCSSCRDIAYSGIADNKEPALVGTLSHMYVGYGTKRNPAVTNDVWIKCYPGWKENADDDVWLSWSSLHFSMKISIKSTLLKKFNVPATAAIPTGFRKYSRVYTLGTGGPNLSNVFNSVLNWQGGNTGLYQFTLETTNGNPRHYTNLTSYMTYSLNTTSPQMTINGSSGFAGLEGEYWINVVGNDMVLVAKSGAYALYFTNASTPPSL